MTRDVRWLDQRLAAGLVDQLGDAGMTTTQALVLDAVEALPGSNQTQLTAATLIDRSTLSDVVRRLATAGYVMREDSKQDARMYAIKTSAAGRSALVQVKAAIVKVEKGLVKEAKALAASW